MPKATLSFNLPEEREEFTIASRALDTESAIEEYQNWLRSKLKYEELTDEQDKCFEEAREKWFQILNDRLR